MVIASNDNHVGEPLTFLSVCSGIEAASVAWKPLGWKCIGVAEIEPFPAFALAHHYGAGRPKFMPSPGEPGLKPADQRKRKAALKAVAKLPVDAPLTNWGDFTRIDTTQLGQVDILCGGTPCQAFSVAGLRQSLADARGNLSLSFVRLAHELADRNGLRNAVWENVVGVLSTKDNAFGCFLAGLVGADSPIEPPARGKWGGAGMVSGPKGRAAWRVLDAQYFGVAQRRRRVIVVADFGSGADPAQVLFELDSVQRHSAPSREAGKGASVDVAPSLVSSGRGVERTGDTRGQDPVVAWSIMPQNSGKDFKARQVDVAQPLVAGGPVGGNQGGDYIQQPVAYAPDVARCVATREGSSQDYETTTMVVVDVAPTMRAGGNTTGGDRPYGSDVDTCDSLAVVSVTGHVAHTLRAEGADASEDGTGRGTPIVAYASDVAPSMVSNGDAHSGFRHYEGLIAFDTTQITSKANHSVPSAGDPCHPLNSQAYPPAITVAIRGRDGGATAELGGEVATALRASQGGGDKPHVLAFQSSQSGVRVDDVHATLDSNNGSRRHNGALYGSAVRRLTPVECERLQGFPDGYTNIPWRGKSTSPDGPRYKALGNSWAVPKFVWLGRRLAVHMPVIVNKSSDLRQAA